VCTFIRAEIDYHNPQDLFGGVAHGVLTLGGRLLSAIPVAFGYKLLLRETHFDTLIWDDHRFDPTDVRIMALPLVTSSSHFHVRLLLLTTSSPDPGRYIRVGVGSIALVYQDDYLCWLEAFTSLPETEIIIV
jgi:hypothetical protein